jgi:hypothetical protein
MAQGGDSIGWGSKTLRSKKVSMNTIRNACADSCKFVQATQGCTKPPEGLSLCKCNTPLGVARCTKSKGQRNSMLGSIPTLAALTGHFDIPVVFAPTPSASARLIESWAYWFAREVVEAANDLAHGHGLTRRGVSVCEK